MCLTTTIIFFSHTTDPRPTVLYDDQEHYNFAVDAPSLYFARPTARRIELMKLRNDLAIAANASLIGARTPLDGAEETLLSLVFVSAGSTGVGFAVTAGSTTAAGSSTASVGLTSCLTSAMMSSRSDASSNAAAALSPDPAASTSPSCANTTLLTANNDTMRSQRISTRILIVARTPVEH